MPQVTVAYLPDQRVTVRSRSGHAEFPVIVRDVMLSGGAEHPLSQLFFCRLVSNPNATAWYELADLKPVPGQAEEAHAP